MLIPYTANESENSDGWSGWEMLIGDGHRTILQPFFVLVCCLR